MQEDINSQGQEVDLKGNPLPPAEPVKTGFYDSTPREEPTREERKTERKKGRKGGCLRGCLIFLIVLLFLLALLTGAIYFGYRRVIGSMQPVDLGVEYSRGDYTGFMEELGLEAAPSTLCIDCPTPNFSEPQEIDISVSNEEASATFEYVNQYLSNANVTGTQIRMGDGSVELSTILDYDGMSFPVYMTGSISKDGERSVAGEISSIKVGQLTVPDSVRIMVENFLLSTANDKLAAAGDSVRIDSIDITSEGLNFKGLIPTKTE